MSLKYQCWTSIRGSLTRTAPPGLDKLKIVPTSHTLVYGNADAVLIDVPLTADASLELVDWIASFNKNLTYIYITHPHGDHYFGLSVVLERFPNAKAIATKEGVAAMKKEIAREQGHEAFFSKLFPTQLPTTLVVPEAVEGDLFQLEGETMTIVKTGHTDTDDTTTLYVPSIGLAITGDAVYNNVHPFVGESRTKARRDMWVAALDQIASLKPKFVVCGHKDPNQDDDPRVIAETRQYFADLDRLNEQTRTKEELYFGMLELYPTRLNPGSLWGAASMLKEHEENP